MMRRGGRGNAKDKKGRCNSHDHIDLGDLAFKDFDDANHRCPYRFRLMR